MQDLYNEAHEAGIAKAQAVIPVPMNIKSGGKEYHVEDGVCGFGWVSIHPARGKFITFLKKNNIGSKAYGGGYRVSSAMNTQSLARNAAYAEGFAEVLNANGLKAYAQSRID